MGWFMVGKLSRALIGAALAVSFPSVEVMATDWRDLERSVDFGEAVGRISDSVAAVGADGTIFLSFQDWDGPPFFSRTAMHRLDPITLVGEPLEGLPDDAGRALPICTFSDIVGVAVAYMVPTGDDGGGLYLQRYASATTPAGAPVLVATQTSGDLSTVALDCEADGAMTVAWQTKAGDDPSFGIVARRFDAGGTPVSAEIAIAGPSPTPLRPLDIARLADGALVATWLAGCPYAHPPDCHVDPLPMGPDGSFGAVLARVIRVEGAAPTSEFIVNTTWAGRQGIGSGLVVPGADGSFGIVWDGEGRHEDQGIWMRSFSALGIPTGDERALSGVGDSKDASGPQLAGHPDTGYTVVWTSQNSDDRTVDIGARRLDENGQMLGKSFRVNLTKSGKVNPQHPRAVASSSEGDLIAFWTNSDVAPDAGLVMRRVSRSAPACPIVPASCVVADRGSLLLTRMAGTSRLDAELASDFLPPLAVLGAAGLGGLTACVYAGSGADSALLAHATIPVDPRCREGSCWRWSTSGLSYADRLGELGTVRQATVRERPHPWWPSLSPGSVRITARGSGVIDAPGLVGVAAPLRLEVHGSDGQCWRAELLDVRTTGGGIRADLG